MRPTLHRTHLPAILAAAVLGALLPGPEPAAQGVMLGTPYAYPLDPQPSALVMNAHFAGEPNPSFGPLEIQDAFTGLADFLLETSYQEMGLSWTVVDVQLPLPKSGYVLPPNTPDLGRLMQDALAVADGLVQDPLEGFEFHVVLSKIKDTGGNGFPGGKVFCSTLNFPVLAQEFIHSLNVPHSTGLTNEGSASTCVWDPLSPSTHYEERGNIFDVMSSAGIWGELSHADVRIKHYLGWLPPRRVLDVQGDGTYPIWQMDTSTLPPPGPIALRIHRDGMLDYWVEFRQLIQTNSPACAVPTNVDEGALVYFADKGWRYLGPMFAPFRMAQLLDMHPLSAPACEPTLEWLDAALETDEWFCDGAGIEIGVESYVPATQGTPGSVRVIVNVPETGWQPQPNHPSSILFLDPPTTVTTYSQTARFEAEVTDTEGVTAVDFEIYRMYEESPFQIEAGSPIGNDVWQTQTIDVSGWAKGGYAIVPTATDGSGRKESFGTFVMVDNG